MQQSFLTSKVLLLGVAREELRTDFGGILRNAEQNLDV